MWVKCLSDLAENSGARGLLPRQSEALAVNEVYRVWWEYRTGSGACRLSTRNRVVSDVFGRLLAVRHLDGLAELGLEGLLDETGEDGVVGVGGWPSAR